jgi:transcriptional regulator with XRE-family HTH domain
VQDFARRLSDLLIQHGMRQSDLARAMYGEELDKTTGRPVAKHRDRISMWVSGKNLPDPTNMALLAKTLGVSPEHLAEPLVAQAVDRERSSLQIIQAAGHPDKVHLKVDMLVPQRVASRVMALLVGDE